MVQVVPGRYTARMDEPFIVFVIGMRIIRPLAVRKWVPAFRRDGADAARALPAPGERLSQSGFLPLPLGTGDPPVLAFLRGPGEVREEPRRPAPACLAALQPDRRLGRERRHLPRDLQRRAGELRGDLLEYARLRAGQGDRTMSRPSGAAKRRAGASCAARTNPPCPRRSRSYRSRSASPCEEAKARRAAPGNANLHAHLHAPCGGYRGILIRSRIPPSENPSSTRLGEQAAPFQELQ